MGKKNNPATPKQRKSLTIGDAQFRNQLKRNKRKTQNDRSESEENNHQDQESNEQDEQQQQSKTNNKKKLIKKQNSQINAVALQPRRQRSQQLVNAQNNAGQQSRPKCRSRCHNHSLIIKKKIKRQETDDLRVNFCNLRHVVQITKQNQLPAIANEAILNRQSDCLFMGQYQLWDSKHVTILRKKNPVPKKSKNQKKRKNKKIKKIKKIKQQQIITCDQFYPKINPQKCYRAICRHCIDDNSLQYKQHIQSDQHIKNWNKRRARQLKKIKQIALEFRGQKPLKKKRKLKRRNRN